MNKDRISVITNILDEVFYKSSIIDMRKFYFNNTEKEKKWLLFSDYYFEDKKPNKTITFTAMPYIADLIELQKTIQIVAPKDIKHTKNINEEFIRLINSMPIINIIFIFDQKKYFIWDSSHEFKREMLQYVEVLNAYIAYWKVAELNRKSRLDQFSKNLQCLERLLKQDKKLRLIAAMFFVSLLGGFVGSLIYRETNLSSLAWFSDRDSTNEICGNLIRDLFQITLIDITKKNIQFSFATSNSDSDEWYEGITRIPDYLTGTISSFNFDEEIVLDDKIKQMLEFHFRYNIKNTFLYRFRVSEEDMKIQRMLVVDMKLPE